RIRAGRRRRARRALLPGLHHALPLPRPARARRADVARRRMRREPVLLALQTVLVTGILACVLLLADRHPWRLDLTPERRFTLPPPSREVLGRMSADVTLTAFYSSQETGMREDLGDLLALYRDASTRVHTRLLDLDRSPGEAERLGAHGYNVVVVETGERR